MYERMLCKDHVPSLLDIQTYLGYDAYARLCKMVELLSNQYEFHQILRFPFGNSYGWGYKFSHRNTHLAYVFFEKCSFTVMIQIGDRLVPKVDAILSELMPKSRELWKNRYPCGEQGGWIQYRIKNDSDLQDAIALIHIKKRPVKKDTV